MPWLSSASRRSVSCSEGSVILSKVSGPTHMGGPAVKNYLHVMVGSLLATDPKLEPFLQCGKLCPHKLTFGRVPSTRTMLPCMGLSMSSTKLQLHCTTNFPR